MVLYKHLDAIRKLPPTGTTTQLVFVRQRLVLPVTKHVLPLHHVALIAEDGTRRHILEHGPYRAQGNQSTDDLPALGVLYMPLPSVDLTLEEILAYEDTLPRTYIVGVRDCRHHVRDLLKFVYL